LVISLITVQLIKHRKLKRIGQFLWIRLQGSHLISVT